MKLNPSQSGDLFGLWQEVSGVEHLRPGPGFGGDITRFLGRDGRDVQARRNSTQVVEQLIAQRGGDENFDWGSLHALGDGGEVFAFTGVEIDEAGTQYQGRQHNQSRFGAKVTTSP